MLHCFHGVRRLSHHWTCDGHAWGIWRSRTRRHGYGGSHNEVDRPGDNGRHDESLMSMVGMLTMICMMTLIRLVGHVDDGRGLVGIVRVVGMLTLGAFPLSMALGGFP